MADASLAPIVEALEVAVAVARRDASTPDAPPPPRALAPFLRFNRLPDRALATVRDVLDDDEAFRARVAEQVDHDALEPGARLFLLRPDGWAEELAALADAAVDDARRRSDDQVQSEAARRAEQLELANARLRAELAEATRAAESAAEDLDDERRARAQAEAAAGDLAAALEASASSRAEAVRQLKATEALARGRLEKVRELERRIDESDPASPTPGPTGVTDAGPGSRPTGAPAAGGSGAGAPVGDMAPASAAAAGSGPDTAATTSTAATTATAATVDADTDTAAAAQARLAAAARSVRAAADAASALAAALTATADALAPVPADADADADADRDDHGPGAPAHGPTGPNTGIGPPDPASTGRPDTPRRGGRRLPVRVGRGLIEDSVDGLAALLARPSMVMMVDGYNVSMAGWPQQPIAVQRDRLVDLLATVQARTGAEVHVVFDGDDDGRRPAVSVPRPVRIHFTEAGVEADDRLLEFADRLGPEVPVVVVSSDRRVRDGARARGANVVSSPHLLALGRG